MFGVSSFVLSDSLQTSWHAVYQGFAILSHYFNDPNFFMISKSCLANHGCFFCDYIFKKFPQIFHKVLVGAVFGPFQNLHFLGFQKIRYISVPVTWGTIMHEDSTLINVQIIFSLSLITVVPSTFCPLWSYQGEKSTKQRTNCMA